MSSSAPDVPTSFTRDQVAVLFAEPLLDLVFGAAAVHRQHHDPREIQCSSLLSVKTGACPEDCGYCPQSAHHAVKLEASRLMDVAEVLAAAEDAKGAGADRFCMGAAWREVRDNADFERVLAMVRGVKALGLETCVTLGMLQDEQAVRLREAGLDYYNHNLDTSRAYYDQVITTRTYDARLETLAAVRAAGLKVCVGGILGMGESEDDRIDFLCELARLEPQPESVPINTLVAVAGTPLEGRPEVPWDELVRAVAVARILMPRSRVRLSAGRSALSHEAQAMCFLAGASSIFLGDRLLTTPNASLDADAVLLDKLGLRRAGGGATEHDQSRPSPVAAE